MVAYTTSRTLDFFSNIPFIGSVESLFVRIPWGVVKTSICAVGATYEKLETGSTGKWGEGLVDGLQTTGRGTIQLIPFVGSMFAFYYKPYKKGLHYEWHGLNPFEDNPLGRNYVSYEGGWENKGPQGYGKMNYINRDVYEGLWDKGRPSRGKMTYYVTNNVYDGDWKEGEKHGEGTLTYANDPIRKTYKGHWEYDRQSGYGKMTFKDGGFYDGQWARGNRNGEGTYQCSQYTYTGTFSSDIFNGQGKMTLPNGTICEGKWDHGLLVEGTFIEDGIKYKGTWYTKNHDTRSITPPTGVVINKKDSMEQVFGEGTIIYADKSFYEGEMIYGKPHGKGVMTSPDGTSLGGKWVFGECKVEQKVKIVETRVLLED